MTTNVSIEDYLPIEAISAEASREKSIRKGHISTLHLWWWCCCLVYVGRQFTGAVSALRFVPEGASDEESKAKDGRTRRTSSSACAD